MKCRGCGHHEEQHYQWMDGKKGCRVILCGCKGYRSGITRK